MSQWDESRERSNAPVPENVKEIKLQPYYTIKLQEVLHPSDINPSSKYVLSYADHYSDRLWVSSFFVPPDNAHYLI